MYEYLEDGMDKKQVIDRVSKEMNLDTEQLLNIVNKELKRRVHTGVKSPGCENSTSHFPL